MRAIIEVDVPDYQIGQEVSIYFKDTMMIKGIVQEPSGDLISRQEVLDGIEELKKIHFDRVVVLNKVRDRVLDLSSVTPQEPKTGHWKKIQSGDKDFPESIVCSRCGHENSYLDFGISSVPIGKSFKKSKFCPNCGAKMVEPQESEEDGR